MSLFQSQDIEISSKMCFLASVHIQMKPRGHSLTVEHLIICLCYKNSVGSRLPSCFSFIMTLYCFVSSGLIGSCAFISMEHLNFQGSIAAIQCILWELQSSYRKRLLKGSNYILNYSSYSQDFIRIHKNTPANHQESVDSNHNHPDIHWNSFH